MLTLEEWANFRRYESLSGARPPRQPRARYQWPLPAEESVARAIGINRLSGIGDLPNRYLHAAGCLAKAGVLPGIIV